MKSCNEIRINILMKLQRDVGSFVMYLACFVCFTQKFRQYSVQKFLDAILQVKKTKQAFIFLTGFNKQFQNQVLILIFQEIRCAFLSAESGRFQKKKQVTNRDSDSARKVNWQSCFCDQILLRKCSIGKKTYIYKEKKFFCTWQFGEIGFWPIILS